MGKTAKSRSQRRQIPGVTVQSPDAETQPFGAMVHMDHIEMERGSEAAQAARYSLNIHDEKTEFLMCFPCRKRNTETVLDSVNCNLF